MPLRSPIRAGLLLLVSLVLPLVLPSRISAQAFVAIDFPNAKETGCDDVNSSGTIVGYYVDANNTTHGFSWTNGVFTTVDMPGSTYTVIWGINDQGDMVGTYTRSGSHGFVLRQGVFRVVDHPGSLWTTLYDINDSGVIVGYYGTGDDDYTGFVYDGLRFDDLLFSSSASGINNKNEVVGSHTEFQTNGFIYRDGKFRFFATRFGGDTVAAKINDYGRIVGRFITDDESWGYVAAYVASPERDVRIIAFPGSIETRARGINNNRVIVGRYTDSSNKIHGFMTMW